MAYIIPTYSLTHLIVVAHGEADVVRHDGHEINDRHHRPHKLPAVRRGKQPQKVF